MNQYERSPESFNDVREFVLKQNRLQAQREIDRLHQVRGASTLSNSLVYDSNVIEGGKFSLNHLNLPKSYKNAIRSVGKKIVSKGADIGNKILDKGADLAEREAISYIEGGRFDLLSVKKFVKPVAKPVSKVLKKVANQSGKAVQKQLEERGQRVSNKIKERATSVGDRYADRVENKILEGVDTLENKALSYLEGSGMDKRKKRGELVKSVMKKHKVSLPIASKMIKEGRV